MKVTVGTTPMPLGVDSSGTPILQNLGPGTIYFDGIADVSANSGIRLGVGDLYEFARDLSMSSGAIYVVSSAADTDLRVLVVG